MNHEMIFLDEDSKLVSICWYVISIKLMLLTFVRINIVSEATGS